MLLLSALLALWTLNFSVLSYESPLFDPDENSVILEEPVIWNSFDFS